MMASRREPLRFTREFDQARRVVWRAFQRGKLTEDELARALDEMDLLARAPQAARAPKTQIGP